MLDYLKLLYYLFRPNTIFVRKRSGALGDQLLMTTVLEKLKQKYPNHKLIVEADWTMFFKNNPHVNWVTNKHFKTTKRHFKPKYHIDVDSQKNMIEQMLESIGLEGYAPPVLHLDAQNEQKLIGMPNKPYIAICPVGKMTFSANRKEWGQQAFQQLVNMMAAFQFVQIGTRDIPLLNNVIDMRGEPVLNSAFIIKNALFFVGIEGGLMHLTRAVNNRSAIIYGGAVDQKVSGYKENLNITNQPHCAPCFHSNRKHTMCETMECMQNIEPKEVYKQIKTFFKEELNSEGKDEN